MAPHKTSRLVVGWMLAAAGFGAVGLAARGESLAAFDGRCILGGCVAPPSNTRGILGRRALPARRLARLGATPDFHHGLQGQAVPPTRRIPEASPNAAVNVRFSDVTAAAGLSGFRHVSGGADKNYIIETTGSGVALWDFDGDGLLDIYLVNGSTLEPRAGGPPRAALFRNNGDRTFRDVTAAAGVANERWGQGVCAGDIDNDGDPDLYVTNFGPNRLFRNLGDGRFDDVAVRAGVAVESWSTGCAFGDYDGDGWLDLYVAGYVAFDAQKPPPSPPRRQGLDRRRPRAAGSGRDGRGVLGRRGVLHLPRASGDVRSARAPRRTRSPLPQQRRRHLHRHDTSGRRHRREGPLRVRRRLARSGRRRAAGPAGRQRLGAQLRVPQRRPGPVRGHQLPVRRCARRERPRAGPHGRGDRRLRQRRTRRHPHHELRRRLQRALSQSRRQRA